MLHIVARRMYERIYKQSVALPHYTPGSRLHPLNDQVCNLIFLGHVSERRLTLVLLSIVNSDLIILSNNGVTNHIFWSTEGEPS